MSFVDSLISIVGEKNVCENILMKEHSTFKAGGPADFFVSPSNKEQIINTIKLCREHEIKYHIHGNGSNVLFSDAGYRGVVICIGANMSDISIKDNIIVAQAGVPLSKLSNSAANAGLSGLEFTSGIPGTLGGAVTMNAGAYGGEIKDVITSALVCNIDGSVFELSKDELRLDYRKSVIQEKDYVALEASFELTRSDTDEIRVRMKDYNQRRRDKQPLEFASAGSTFKRPEGYFAGKLIEDSGLKGFKIGDAMVSEKHAGFVINTSNASSADIMAVIKHVQDEVYKKQGVKLETEVRLIL